MKPIGFLAVSFELKSFRSHARFLLSLDKFEPTIKKNLKVSPEGEGFRPIARTIKQHKRFEEQRLTELLIERRPLADASV
ncbi:MAG: hypothetical protein CMN21_12005 [Rubinisphaera sp.]|nr:hypothetical protein [Rubinisphaera sp.]